MIRIVIVSRAPSWAIPGIKEDLTMHLEQYGDCSVVEVAQVNQETQERPQQVQIQAFGSHFHRGAVTM